ncbi:MAG: amino acid adenylation domain-containing protein [Gemmatimonadota bacterium]|nr:MAG: amino acid adenylation domain-containing protein [Gemmatimonadota bacterium]
MSERSPLYPTSCAQQQLWFQAQLDPESHVSNIASAVRLHGSLRVPALERSLDEIARRHKALRTTFLTRAGQLKQVVAQSSIPRLPVHDLTVFPESEREDEARRLLTEKARRPFDLATGPLFLAGILRLGVDDHILFTVMHRIIADNWSLGIFFQEFFILYEAYSTGKSSPLPELTTQYHKFAQWQCKWMKSKSAEEQLSYWKQRLAHVPFTVNLPTDGSRHGSRRIHQGATQSLMLPESLSHSLRALSHQEEVTLPTILLAAWHVLLYRYTNQGEIVVGFTTEGRRRSGMEEPIGLCSNILALRMPPVRDNPAFRELLKRMRGVILEAYANQDVPFENVMEELQSQGDLDRTPQFQVAFQFDHRPDVASKPHGLDVKDFEFEKGISRHDVTLKIVEKVEELSCSFEYNTDLFEATTIARMGWHFKRLLEGIVDQPDEVISDLPLLTEGEWHQLLVEWNTVRVENFKEEFYHRSFEFQAERLSDAVAVVFEGEHLTYQELNVRANQLAHYLQALGVGPDVLVGMCMERSPELVVGVLATLKAGGACVPLDPTFPEDWFAFVLEDTDVQVVLTQDRLLKKLAGHTGHVICLDSAQENWDRESTENPVRDITSENLSFVYYTSGSTGIPKAVMQPYRKVDTTESLVSFTEEDRHLFKASIGFTPFGAEILTPLMTGGKMIIAEPGRSQDSTYLVPLITKHTVTYISVVPAMLRMLLEQDEIETCRSLKHVLSFGEPLPHDLRERFFTRTAANLYVLYGTTEAPSATFKMCQRGDDASSSGGFSIGRRLSGNRIHIMSLMGGMQPVPIGVPGELCCSGFNLARGYLNRPDLTAERFVPDPVGDEPGARLYKTGDLARYLPDGNIEFLGRIDHQVKLRGLRIELAEIEAILRQHVTVFEVAVVMREDEPGNNRLAAYVVPNQGSTISISELRSFLRVKLPEYMVPSAFVELDALSLTRNGKIDRQALPAPDRVRPEQGRAFIAPRDALENHLVKIWEKLLGIKPIGVRDSFFDLGGHSLLAVRLFAQIEKMLDKKLSLANLLEAPTVEQLAGLLRQEGEPAHWSSLVAIQSEGTKLPFFWVPPAAADVISLADLARHLGPDRPFYGLQPLGLEGNQSPHAHVEEMAAHYIKEIRNIQSEGPYLLGGICFGGIVAFEMACRLHEQNDSVAFLALLDSSQPPPLISLRDYVPRLLLHHLPRGQLTYCLKKDLREKGTKWKWKLSRSHGGRRFYRVWNVHETARRAYVPRPYPGRITLFESREFRIRFPDYEARWSALTEEGLDCHTIACDHGDFLHEPYVRIVAEKLKNCLEGVPSQNDAGRNKKTALSRAPIINRELLG